MVRKIIPQNLKPQGRLKYIKKDKEDAINDLCQLILEMLNIEYKISQQRKDRDRNCNGNSVGNCSQN